MSEKRTLINLLLALPIAGASLGGCAMQESVTFKSNGTTETFTQGQAALSTSCPLPVYPGAKAAGSKVSEGDAKENDAVLMLRSKDSVDKVGQFYEQRLKTDGWKVESNTALPGNVINLSASKGDLEGNVMLAKDQDGQTSINLEVSHAAEGQPGKVFTNTQTLSPDKLNPPTD
jgi:hypothetical protein